MCNEQAGAALITIDRSGLGVKHVPSGSLIGHQVPGQAARLGYTKDPRLH
jgi:hypothetical protein